MLDSNEHYFRSRNRALPHDSHSLREINLWSVDKLSPPWERESRNGLFLASLESLFIVVTVWDYLYISVTTAAIGPIGHLSVNIVQRYRRGKTKGLGENLSQFCFIQHKSQMDLPWERMLVPAAAASNQLSCGTEFVGRGICGLFCAVMCCYPELTAERLWTSAATAVLQTQLTSCSVVTSLSFRHKENNYLSASVA
jgi:hypothetical protein